MMWSCYFILARNHIRMSLNTASSLRCPWCCDQSRLYSLHLWSEHMRVSLACFDSFECLFCCAIFIFYQRWCVVLLYNYIAIYCCQYNLRSWMIILQTCDSQNSQKALTANLCEAHTTPAALLYRIICLKSMNRETIPYIHHPMISDDIPHQTGERDS